MTRAGKSQRAREVGEFSYSIRAANVECIIADARDARPWFSAADWWTVSFADRRSGLLGVIWPHGCGNRYARWIVRLNWNANTTQCSTTKTTTGTDIYIANLLLPSRTYYTLGALYYPDFGSWQIVRVGGKPCTHMSGLENSTIGFDKVTFALLPKTLKRSIFTFDRGVKSKNISFVSARQRKTEYRVSPFLLRAKENI